MSTSVVPVYFKLCYDYKTLCLFPFNVPRHTVLCLKLHFSVMVLQQSHSVTVQLWNTVAKHCFKPQFYCCTWSKIRRMDRASSDHRMSFKVPWKYTLHCLQTEAKKTINDHWWPTYCTQCNTNKMVRACIKAEMHSSVVGISSMNKMFVLGSMNYGFLP